MALAPLPGYVSLIWAAMKTALSTANSGFNLSNPTASISLTQAVAQTLRNGVMAIDAYMLYSGLQQAAQNLNAVLALPVVLDATTTAYLTSMITALDAAAISASKLIVVPSVAGASVLTQGSPSIPDPLLIEWMMAFRFSENPFDLQSTNFSSQAAASANGWSTLAAALASQGISVNGQTINAISQIGAAASVSAYEVSKLPISSVGDVAIPTSSAIGSFVIGVSPIGGPASPFLNQAWNLVFVLPTLSRVASLISSDPSSATSQQIAALRYVGLTALQQFQQLLVSFATTAPAQVATAQVRLGDSLMDIAAREMGDYTQWSAIAQLNGLVPPYTASVESPGVAGPGRRLFLPTGSPLPQVGAQTASYAVNVLGTDKYLGPLNQDMLPWTGDFQLISGTANLALSLGRRLQTTLGTMIYHPNYGSRIPPEIGDIEVTTTALLIEAFAKSALLGDPRVASVPKVKVTVGQNNLISVAATVTPIGQGSGIGDVNVNAVLQPI